mmetsp:Transcript_32493/g.71011  ORF Transcript_32493/g.71011 Transcript_32493/m.71011 type:complete len:338 (-) Transcript_32493:259-1272(-)|eukprot:CAMPEP_0118943456 /NCGR_PEP_ID=MMETSP1169-20130426/38367_1 /TAXON_ID=36882 /ORGANISM="Pyramimonas obovata, Strain CCMP722" /LENGTH=337 /DNA_ID=CAMNT_0006888719 /DNA_START=253 /DNA_END=1266 /DNA_ORIENTATION=+
MGAGHSRRNHSSTNETAQRATEVQHTNQPLQAPSPYNHVQRQQYYPHQVQHHTTTPVYPPHPMYPSYNTHPAPHSYEPPAQPEQTQKTSTIRNDVNLKKKTLEVHEDPAKPNHLALSFSFDAAAPCSISVFFNANENVQDSCRLTQQSGAIPGPRVHFKKGLGQVFKLDSAYSLDLSTVPQKDLLATGPERFPVIVRLETIKKEGNEEREFSQPPGGPLPKWVQAQTTYATLVKGEDGKYIVRVLKQKIWVDGTSYELQEIYGIEGSAGGTGAAGDDTGKECVICMSEARDTTVLPCRHMCMCSGCAKLLRHQTNRCPICRTMVEGLLEIKVEPRRA